MPSRVRLPDAVAAMAGRGDDWSAWVDGLARTAAAVLEEWQLTLDGAAMHGFCSLVLPVRTPGGTPSALKLTFTGDDESEHEHLALQHWAGRGAVRLLRADPHRRALLLERLHPESLAEVPVLEACETVAGLYAAIHVPAMPQLRLLGSYVELWLDGLAALPRNAPLPRRMVEQAVSAGRDLLADPAASGTLVHGDLHYDNVLAADREPWLVIDPKPVSGDPHYEVAPMLWNRWDEVVEVRDDVRRRFHTLVDVALLDEDRARDWVVVRMMCNALWRLQDPPGTHRVTPTDTWLTTCVAVAKAVQD